MLISKVQSFQGVIIYWKLTIRNILQKKLTYFRPFPGFDKPKVGVTDLKV